MTNEDWPDRETYEGALLFVVLAAVKKARAGLRHAASGEYQDYPSGILELGVALDAIQMVANDILHFIVMNSQDTDTLLRKAGYDPDELGNRMRAVAEKALEEVRTREDLREAVKA